MRTFAHIALLRLRAALLVSLFAPFVLFQLVAAGAMPVATSDGIAMVLCSGDEIIAGVMDADGVFHPTDPDTPHSATQDCPWALVHAPAIGMGSQPGASAGTVSLGQAEAVHPAFRLLPQAGRRPPVRAPPVTV